MWELFGLTPEQIAENESWSTKKGRKRDFGDKVGDRIMSALTGIDYTKEVGEAVKNNYVEELESTYGGRIDATKGTVGYEELGDLSKLSGSKLDQELEKRERTKAARSKAGATTGLDISEFQHLTDPGEILALASSKVKDEQETEKLRLETKAQTETERLEGRYDAQRASDEAWRRYQSEENNAWRKSQSEKEDKRYDMQMQLAIMDRADKREDRRIAREDRQADKRQASIMMLIKGLSQLGAGFSI